MQKLITLTPSEKSKIENEKQLYVLLRLINLVEQYHNYDKITKQEYKNEMPKLLEKYQGFTRVFPNFKLSQFLKSHQIGEDQVLWANAALEKGMNMQEDIKKQTYLFMEATAKFIQINDKLAMNQDNPILNQIKTPIQELLIILKRLHTKIGVQFSQKYQYLQKMYESTINNRPITDVLTSTQFNELKSVIQIMYRILGLSMKN